jgi:pyrimidine-nucleoside phosphorylase
MMVDIIAKKRDGGELSREEIRFAISEGVPDYQLSALLMAICLRGMTARETGDLALEMMDSGERFDFMVDRTVVDLHSTGGVGDKCTMIVCPIVAACGVKVAKMAGRGLGHTGGTVDKLMAFKGMNMSLTPEEFVEQVNKHGIAIIEQTDEITPADRRLYHLRDVTSTVESIPLIASSIMSKKLATGARNIVLDVTYGTGAFMKTREDAEKLAKAMVEIGEHAGRKVIAILTDMNEPLGRAVGNNLEVAESIQALKGEWATEELKETCYKLAKAMLLLGLLTTETEADFLIDSVVQDGTALTKFREMVEAQGGEWTEEFERAPVTYEVELDSLDAYQIGSMARNLGAGRMKKDDDIDLRVGIVIKDREKKIVEVHKEG